MVHISEPVLSTEDGDSVVVAELSGISPAGSVRQRLPGSVVPSAAAMNDSLFGVGLLLAMSSGSRLEMDGAVSHSLLEQSSIVQDIFLAWYPEVFSRVHVEVETRRDGNIVSAEGVVSTFTAGVDSLYTLQQHNPEISTLVYVHGFDIPLRSRKMRADMSSHLEDAARSAGKRLIQGVSNVRRFLNPHLAWSSMSHGAAITGFCHLLSDGYGKLFLPSSFTYDRLFPWGSHPLLDLHWSTNRLRVIHDGAGANRATKTLAIANNELAQRHLKVCFQRDGSYNCGTCKKCVRTKIALDISGKLKEFQTLPGGIAISDVERFGIRSEGDLAFAADNLRCALQAGRTDVSSVLQRLVDQYSGN